MVWYSHVFQNFPQFIVIHTVKGFGIANKAEIDVFLELSCFFVDPANVGNLISGSSAFSKTSLSIYWGKTRKRWCDGGGREVVRSAWALEQEPLGIIGSLSLYHSVLAWGLSFWIIFFVSKLITILDSLGAVHQPRLWWSSLSGERAAGRQSQPLFGLVGTGAPASSVSAEIRGSVCFFLFL